MGIHGNATAVLNFDGAKGWLVGEINKGMNHMFIMMNAARLGTGMQGLGLGEVAYQNALAYAKDRLQSRSLTGPKAKDKPADPIIVHPDVRKMLLNQMLGERRTAARRAGRDTELPFGPALLAGALAVVLLAGDGAAL